MKIAFDIGGCISRYPDLFRFLMYAVDVAGGETHILTDMNQDDARAAVNENQLIVRPDRIWSADWSKDGDLCKTKVMEKHGFDVLIDDRPDYVATGNFVGLVLSPRPDIPYYHHDWANRSTPAVCVPPEEYAEFQAWRASKGK